MRAVGSRNTLTPERQIDIMFAAASAFERRGFEAATLDEICKRAKITKGSLYHHFSNKEDLGVQLYIQIMEEIEGDLKAVLAKAKSARDGVEGLVRGYLDYFDMSATHGKFMFSVMYGRTLERRAADTRAAQQKIVDRFAAWLDPYKERGEVRALPSSLYVSVVIGPSRDFLRDWLVTRDAKSMALALEALPLAAWRAVQPDVEGTMRARPAARAKSTGE